MVLKLVISLHMKVACNFFFKFPLRSDENKGTLHFLTFDKIYEKTFVKTSFVQWMTYGVMYYTVGLYFNLFNMAEGPGLWIPT